MCPQQIGRSPAAIQTLAMMYSSMAASTVVIFFTPFEMQWSSDHILTPLAASVIGRDLNRERKLDRWHFYPMMQLLMLIRPVATFLGICGISRLLLAVNTTLAWIGLGLIWLTVAGVAFFLVAPWWVFRVVCGKRSALVL